MDETGISMEEFKNVFTKGSLFASGVAVDYGPSIIVAKEPTKDESDGTEISRASHSNGTTSSSITDGKAETSGTSKLTGKQHLATNIPIGQRLPSYKVLNQSDARPWHTQELLPSNGHWRILVFAGNISHPPQLSRYNTLGTFLSSPSSPIQKYTPRNQAIDSVIEILTIHSAKRKEIELGDLMEVFHPFKGEEEGWDYWKVFVDDADCYHEKTGEAYEGYGVDREKGCLVVLRPDQYVAWVGELEDTVEMEAFFGGFMRERQ